MPRSFVIADDPVVAMEVRSIQGETSRTARSDMASYRSRFFMRRSSGIGAMWAQVTFDG